MVGGTAQSHRHDSTIASGDARDPSDPPRDGLNTALQDGPPCVHPTEATMGSTPFGSIAPEMYAQLKVDVEEILDRACIEIARREARLKQSLLENARLQHQNAYLQRENDRLRSEVARLRCDPFDSMLRDATSAPELETTSVDLHREGSTRNSRGMGASFSLCSPPLSDLLCGGTLSGASDEGIDVPCANLDRGLAPSVGTLQQEMHRPNSLTPMKRSAPSPDEERTEDEDDGAMHWVDVLRKKWPILQKPVVELARPSTNQFAAIHNLSRSKLPGAKIPTLNIPAALQDSFLKFITDAVGQKLDRRTGVVSSSEPPPSLETQPPPPFNLSPRRPADAMFWTMALRTLWPTMVLGPTVSCEEQIRASMQAFFNSRPDIPEFERLKTIVSKDDLEAFLSFMDRTVGEVLDRHWPRVAPRERKESTERELPGTPEPKRRKSAETDVVGEPSAVSPFSRDFEESAECSPISDDVGLLPIDENSSPCGTSQKRTKSVKGSGEIDESDDFLDIRDEFAGKNESEATVAAAYFRPVTDEAPAWTDLMRTRWPRFKTSMIPNTSALFAKFKDKHGLSMRVYPRNKAVMTYAVPSHLHSALFSYMASHPERLSILCAVPLSINLPSS
ncbi:hypothetical protein DFJ73DRAFT_338673 [Zopfochytrium polystomum]|nr:hypothetical protein DFJ73DRAFT_338673 [Zopfochytrium polystomum]